MSDESSSAPSGDIRPPAYPRLWWIFLLASIAAIAFGVFSFAQQTRHGFVITLHGNPGFGGAAWGTYIVFYIFFVGVSFAGIAVSALSRLFKIDVLRPATRLAEMLTIIALIAGALAIVADLGRPLHGLMNLPVYARPQSPFYGTFTLVVAGYLFSSIVFFFLSTRQDAAGMATRGPRPLRWLYRLWASGARGTDGERSRHGFASFFLSVTILPMLVIAHSTLGFIFGIQPGRPGWFGALQAPAFVILAGVSGTGVLILCLLGARKLFALRDQIPDLTIRWLGNFMATLALVYLYFMGVEELTASYAAPPGERLVAHSIVFGRYALLFWVTVACLVLTFAVPFALKLWKKTSIAAIAVVAVLANVAAVLKRWLIVVPSQVEGALIPIEPGSYRADLIESGVVIGLVGLIAAVLLVFGRLFPLVPSPHGPAAPGGFDSRRRARLRIAATVATAVLAFALMAIGLIDSFRLLSDGELDPRIPYSPVIFAVGVILFFATAIVYEVIPSPRDPVE